jgi:hypothetical protein
VATVHRITPRAKEVGEAWERGGRRLLRGKQNEIEREGARTGLGWAGSGRAGTEAHNTRDHGSKPNTNRNPKRGEMDVRLNTTSDKRNMLRHDATPMSTKVFVHTRYGHQSLYFFENGKKERNRKRK